MDVAQQFIQAGMSDFCNMNNNIANIGINTLSSLWELKCCSSKVKLLCSQETKWYTNANKVYVSVK